MAGKRASLVKTGYDILNVLQTNLGRKFSAPTLASRIGCGRKAIYHHLDELILAKFPIEIDSGRNGGAWLYKSAFMNGKYFCTEKLAIIRTAVENIVPGTHCEIHIEEILIMLPPHQKGGSENGTESSIARGIIRCTRC